MKRPVEKSTILRRFQLFRCLLVTAAVVAVAVTIIVGIAASGWIDRPFPGFFVLANRVVASIGLPNWAGARDGTLYQRTVVAIDGQPVTDGAQVYSHVDRHTVGTPLTYELRKGAATETLTIRSAVFSRADYWKIFGCYLGTSLLYLLMGLLGAWSFRQTQLGRALFFVGSVAGIWGLSAVGIYGPSFQLRIHALAEALLPATLVYLALVFPREQDSLLRPLLAVASCLSLALAIPYQLLLYQPGPYSTMHAACETYLGLAGLALTGTLVVEYVRNPDADFFLRATIAGALFGLATPAVVMLISGVSGGSLPVNVLTVTACLFPLCVGCGLLHARLIGHRIPITESSEKGSSPAVAPWVLTTTST